MPKSYFFFFILFTSIFLFVVKTEAQSIKEKKTTTDSDSSDSKRSLTVEMDAGTSRGYQARRRTTTPASSQKYVEPILNYVAPSGFFASFAAYKTPGVKRSWDELDLGLGYDFKISKSADVDGSVGYTHFTYSAAAKQTVNPSSEDLDAYVKHDFDIIAVKLTGDYYFGGSNNDEDLIADIDHDFYIDKIFSKKDELSIDPTITIIGGTTNYYLGTLAPPNATKKQKEAIKAKLNNFQFNSFILNDYEFALPVNYEIGKFDMEIAWRYSIPSNLPAIFNAKPFSYVTAYISYDFLK